MAGIVDIGLALLVLLSLIAGFKNGFVDSLFSLAAWLGGILVGVHLARPVLDRLPPFTHRVPGAVIVTGVLLFLVAFSALRLLGAALAGKRKSDPEPADRWLGALFGLARGLFLAAATASFLVAYLPAEGKVLRQSRSLPLLAPAGRVVAGMAPGNLRARMDDGWSRLLYRDRVGSGALPT